MSGQAILSGRGLSKRFPVRKGVLMLTGGHVRALSGFDFDLAAGETIGVVGESGCGKTTLGRVIGKIHEGEGSLVYTDREGKTYEALGRLPRARELAYRRDVQVVFQDPYASLDPRMRIADIVAEPLRAHGLAKDRAATLAAVASLLEKVGLKPEALGRYPHEFSGGQRQRVAIARALALRPRVVVCDEPTSALDVSVQSQVVNLLKDVQAAEGLAYVFISHNLDLVRHVSDRVYVMYLGRVVEEAPAEALFDAPAHPYTKALMAAIPDWDPAKRSLLSSELAGEPPSALWDPPGCPFQPRCPAARARCLAEAPALAPVGGPGSGRRASCHFA